MPKIVVLDGFTLNPGDLSWDDLYSLGECQIFDHTPHELTLFRSQSADIILTNKVVINSSVISSLPALKYIGVLATGFNVVDLASAKKFGITVTNIPAYSTDSVAQMVFAHILNFTQRIELHSESVKNGNWTSNVDFSYHLTPQTEIAGKTLGIIGFGRIGQAVAKIGQAFGMKIIFYYPGQKDFNALKDMQVNLIELFRMSDFISINCPLTSENSGFINKSILRYAKPDSFIVNTGRGQLVNEMDMADALNKGIIAGFGTDVLSSEPPTPDNPLLSARNCFITPHIAWATLEARNRLLSVAIENIKCYLGGNPINVVS
jgi:glycerate dehydrogenase